MDNVFIFIFIFLTIFKAISASTPAAAAEPPPFQIPPPQQLGNIIDALIGAGDFSSWVSILSMANPMAFPVSATLLVPQDGGNHISDQQHPAMDPLLLPYHVIPQRLSFSDLLLFKPNTRLPTLLPSMSISITNSSRSNFTLDDTALTIPDLYSTDSVAVHGVATLLDYSVYGNNALRPRLSTPTGNNAPPEALTPTGNSTGWSSDAACLCAEVPIVFLIFCVVLAFKLQKNSIVR